MTWALAALGSNQGDRAGTLDQAVIRLQQDPKIQVKAVSRWQQTESVGGPAGQDPFLNGAVLLEASLSPLELLHRFQAIEQAAQRKREVHWGPRTLDIDLLLFELQIIETDELTVPHPRMMFRRFVMEPAAEIAPDMIHPQLGWSLERIRKHLKTAPNYLALFSPPGFASSSLAEKISQQTLGRLLLDQPAEIEQPAGQTLSQEFCLATLTRQADLLNIATQDSSEQRETTLLVSDFWLGKSLVTADALLSSQEAKQVRVAGESILSSLLPPKLIVCLIPSAEQLSSSSASNQACRISLTREQLENWRTVAKQILGTGKYGPWLLLDGVDEATAYQEVLAAALAMQ